MERNAKEASLWTRGFNWSKSLSQKLRHKPETVGLNANVEALASLFTNPTATNREQEWKHEGNSGEKTCKWLLKESHTQPDTTGKQTSSSGVLITSIIGSGNSVEDKGKQHRLCERRNGAAWVMV